MTKGVIYSYEKGHKTWGHKHEIFIYMIMQYLDFCLTQTIIGFNKKITIALDTIILLDYVCSSARHIMTRLDEGP